MSVHVGGRGPGHMCRVLARFNPLTLYASGETGAWFDASDLTTQYQDSIGTTPAAVGFTVGEIFDKLLGAPTTGSELNTSPTTWGLGTGWANNGDGSYTKPAGTSSSIAKAMGIVQYSTYQVALTVVCTAGSISVQLGTGSNLATVTTSGTYTFKVRAPGTNGAVSLNADASFAGTVSAISTKLIPGRHGFQSTAGNRPLLSNSPGRPALQFSSSSVELDATIPVLTTGDVVYTGPAGTWVDSSVTTAAGATLAIKGDGTKTAGIVAAIGGYLGEALYISRSLTTAERRSLGSRWAGYLEQESGAERVINGTFDTDYSSWSVDQPTQTTSVSGGVVTIAATAAGGSVWQDIAVKSGSPHILALPSITNGFVYLYDGAGFTNAFAGAPLSASSTRALLFTPTGSLVRVRLFVSANSTGTFDNVSVSRLRVNPPTMKWGTKKWASFGDSLTAGNQWQPYVAGDQALRSNVYGVGGTQVSGSATDAFWQDSRVATLPSDAKLVTVLGGTNDWAHSVALGTIDSGDTNTFYGALNALHPKLLTQCPNAVILYVTPPYSEMLDYASRGWADSTHNTLGLTIGDYAAATRAWATAKGTNLSDVNTLCGINASNNTTYMTNDGNLIHPNALGGQLMSNVIISSVSQLQPLA